MRYSRKLPPKVEEEQKDAELEIVSSKISSKKKYDILFMSNSSMYGIRLFERVRRTSRHTNFQIDTRDSMWDGDGMGNR